MKQKRLKPSVRKDAILTAAIKLAKKTHYLKVTRLQIAEAVGVSGPAIQYHFKTMKQLQRDMMRAAIHQECLQVIAQGIVANDRHVGKIAPELKQRAINLLL